MEDLTERPKRRITGKDAPAVSSGLGRFISTASFWIPAVPSMQSAWLEHAPFALWLVDALRPRILVELGTHWGYSYFTFCEAVQRLHIATKCFAVDTWEGDEHAGAYGEEVFQQVHSYNSAKHSGFSTLIRSTFDEALPHFSNGSIDLLHIDGRHFYRDVRHDFDAWLPKLSDRGVILLHDTNVREHDFGVFKLWEELRSQYPSFEFFHGHGLGVLGVGPSLPQNVRPLLSGKGVETATPIRNAYARLGSLFTLKFSHAQTAADASRCAEEVKARTAEARRLQAQLNASALEVTRLEKDLEERTVETTRLQAQLNASALEVTRLEKDLEERTVETTRLQKELQAQSTEASSLKQELSAAAGRAADLESGIRTRAATIEELGRELDIARTRSTELERVFADRSAVLDQVNMHLLSERSRSIELNGLLNARSAEVGRLSQQVTALRAHRGTLERELTTRCNDYSTEHARARSLEQEIKQLRGALEGTRARVAELEGEVTQVGLLEEALAARSRDFAALQIGLAARTRELNALKSSVSWRATAGLRAVARKLPWLVRPLWQASQVLWWALTFRLVRHLRTRRQRQTDHEALASSGMLDAEWYSRKYPEVVAAGFDPMLHYLTTGAEEGRDPNPLFDTDWYLQQNADVRRSGVNPLLHYIRCGAAEGRNPNPLFDTSWYLEQNPDVRTSGTNPLLHYLRFGGAEGRDPNPFFDGNWYCSTYSDVAADGANPLVHYLTYGAKEGREPCEGFDTKRYISEHPEVAAGALNPLAHFIQHGWTGHELVRRDYRSWVKQYDTLTDEDRSVFRASVEKLPARPLISVLMPVYNSNEDFLRRAIESVRRQLYPDWELCISDDASTEPDVRAVLKEYAEQDPRIRVTFRDTNGHISANSNSALELASGEFVALLDADDELAEHALFWVANEVLNHPDTDLIFSDEDKLDDKGERYSAYFKPDWNPALILAQNMFSHLGVFRRTLLHKAGGFRLGFEGSQDHDLLLRCTELTSADRILHIPRVLYHWRAVQGSTASSDGIKAKPYAWEAGARAVEEHLSRSGTVASVKRARDQFYQVEYHLSGTLPRVAVVIPSSFGRNLLPTSLGTLLARTTYPAFDVLLAINEKCLRVPQQRDYLQSLKADSRVRVLAYEDQPFNYSKINNWAVSRSDAPIICLMNDDVEVITPDWLERLVARVQLAEVGAVGSLLYYPNDTIQHAGVILGLHGVAGHQYVNMPKGSPGYFGRAVLEQDLSCVTAACMVLRRQAFEQVGGFNEELAIAFNDVDLCIRLRAAGWRILWTPTVELYHHESASVGRHDSPKRRQQFEDEVRLMQGLWGDTLKSDPFYNPNLSLKSYYCDLAFPPRIAKLPA
ncbi:MAG: glycosyltransferase [Xanthobacteraceae bacterium]